MRRLLISITAGAVALVAVGAPAAAVTAPGFLRSNPLYECVEQGIDDGLAAEEAVRGCVSPEFADRVDDYLPLIDRLFPAPPPPADDESSAPDGLEDLLDRFFGDEDFRFGPPDDIPTPDEFFGEHPGFPEALPPLEDLFDRLGEEWPHGEPWGFFFGPDGVLPPLDELHDGWPEDPFPLDELFDGSGLPPLDELLDGWPEGVPPLDELFGDSGLPPFEDLLGPLPDGSLSLDDLLEWLERSLDDAAPAP